MTPGAWSWTLLTLIGGLAICTVWASAVCPLRAVFRMDIWNGMAAWVRIPRKSWALEAVLGFARGFLAHR